MTEEAPAPAATPHDASTAASSRPRRPILRWACCATLFVAAVFAMKHFVVSIVPVRQQSMWPTLLGDVDRVCVDKTAFMRRAPRRWEIVVFPHGDETLVKRVLSTGGETIKFVGGDLWARSKDGGEEERVRRPPEIAEAMRVPVYPGEGPADASRFHVRGSGAIVDGPDGTIVLKPDGEMLKAHLRSAASDDDRVRDDHRDVFGKFVRGRNNALDVRVVVGDLGLNGGVFRLVHRLRGERRSVEVGPGGLYIRSSEEGGPESTTPFPNVTRPDGLQMDTLDGVFSVSVREGAAWRELWREPRATEKHTGYSTLWFEAEGAPTTLGRLAVSRDVHYVWDRDDEPPQHFVVAGDETFVVGDNVPVSTDSRKFGAVKSAKLTGSVVGIAWPWERMRGEP